MRCGAGAAEPPPSWTQDQLATEAEAVMACLPSSVLPISHQTDLPPARVAYMLRRLERAKRVLMRADEVWCVRLTPPRSR